MITSVLIFLIGSAHMVLADSVETKRLSETRPVRYQLGTLLRSNENEGMLLEQVGNWTEIKRTEHDTGSMVTKNIVVGVSPLKYRHTTITFPIPGDGEGEGKVELDKLVRSRGCIQTRFVAVDQLKSKEIPSDCLLIVSNDLDSSKIDGEVLKNLREKKAILGFMSRLRPVEDKCREAFIKNQIAFIENLDVPKEIDIVSVVLSGKKYYAFNNVFSPFNNATSLFKDEKVKTLAVVNLADVILYEAEGKLDKFCSEKKSDVKLFSHKLLSDKLPIFHDVELPRFVHQGTEQWLRFSGQTGTHLVAPRRFDQSKASIDKISDNLFFAPCVHIKTPFSDVDNFKVSRGALEQWEKDRKLRIPENSIVLLNTGWGKKWSLVPEKYVEGYPGLELEAAKWLVNERKAVAIGIDSLAMDDHSMVKDKKFFSHSYLAKKDIPAILNMIIDDDKFPETGSRCVFSYLRIADGTTSPLALFGLSGYDTFTGGEMKKEVEKVTTEKPKEETTIKAQKIKIEEEESKKVSTKASGERWQFGAVIEPAKNCDCKVEEVSFEFNKLAGAHDKAKMVFDKATFTVDPTRNKLTTLTQSKEMKVRATEGCIETLFVKTYDLKVIKQRLLSQVREGMILILLEPQPMLNDDELLKGVADKKATVGFMSDVVLSSDIRNKLLRNNICILENLVAPHNFNADKVREDRIYYGFKFVFSPMADETSLSGSLTTMEPARKINLADLVVFDEEDVTKRCRKRSIISMSQPFGPAEKVPVYTLVSRPKFVENNTKLEMFSHFGTHFDAPYEFNTNNFDASNLPKQLDHPDCVRIDIGYEGKTNFTIRKQDIVDWESKFSTKIPEGSVCLFATGWSKDKWGNVDEYAKNFPGISLEAAKFLVEERKVIGVGIDSLVFDDFSLASRDRFPTHEYLLAEKKVIGFENIGGDLASMPQTGTKCVMSYLRVKKGSGGMAALFGLLPEQAPAVKPALTTTTAEAQKTSTASGVTSSLLLTAGVVATLALV